MKKYFKFGCMGLVGIFVILLIIGMFATDSEAESTPTTEVENSEEDVPPVPVSNWSYSEDTDEMTNTKLFFAHNQSTNQLDFEFPYSGGSTFNLIIRNKGKGAGNEVILNVDKGQFMTSIRGSEYVNIKFDQEEPVKYSFSSSSDGSNNVIFLSNSSRILKKLKTSDKLMIEAPFFQSGRQVIHFAISGLEWSH